METIKQRKRCQKCGQSYKRTFCDKCLNDFFFRPRPKDLTNRQKSAELISWRKSEIPQMLVLKRAKEFTGYALKMRDIIVPQKFRMLVALIENGKIGKLKKGKNHS